MLIRKQQFTLIELLVVIVVITMLVGITVPVYSRLMTGNAVSYGARIISSQLNMARVEACRSRRTVAVVFADAGTANAKYETDDGVILNKRAFRSCYLADDGKTFDGWIPGTKWEVLPRGAYLDFSDTDNFKGTTLDDGAFTERATDNDQYRALDDESRPAFIIKSGKKPEHVIAFRRNGRPLKDNAIVVTVREGMITDNDTADSASTAIPNYDEDNYLRVKVNRYTGNVRTERR